MTDQPPAAEPERRTTTRRTADAARRRVIARRRAAVGVGVLAVVGIGVFALMGGDVPLIDNGPNGPGEFAFELTNVRAAPVSETPADQLSDVAQEAGDGVKETMDELYFRAFVDTSSWGDYEAAFELFEDQAAGRAEADAEVLTLGPTAGDQFDSIGNASGSLAIVILTDKEDAPRTAVAEVQFLADATASDGSSTEIVSTGSYFLREVDGAWRIFAYRVDRDDQSVAPSPSGSPS